MKEKDKTDQNEADVDVSKKAKSKKKKVPKWLRSLEAQSWQAELLISGLVIAGLLQLPDIFIHWVEGYIIDSSEMGFLFFSMASLLVLAGTTSLIFFFALHFLFRGIWVALLGLNSVYPNGINIESTNGAGPKYWEKAKEKYPNLSAYNQELDEHCSAIFSMATAVVIMLCSFSIIVLFIYQLFRLSIFMFPVVGDYVIHIGLAIYLLFMVFAFAVQYIAKKNPDNKRVEKFMDRYSKIFGSIFSLFIFEKPIGYITSIFGSNSTSKYAMIAAMIAGFLMGVLGGRQVDKSPVIQNFGAEKYMTFNNKPHKILPFNYDNLRKENARIFTPIIPSDVIHRNVLKVFIPTIEREKEHMEIKELSFIQRFKTKRSTRDTIHQNNLAGYKAFNRIYVNDVEYTELDFQYYRHPNAKERGVLTYIPTDSFYVGRNVLEIRKNYFSKDSIQKIIKIPFYFE